MTYLRIQELAHARGLNITTLARRAELAYTTAHALWHGTASQVSLKTLDRLAVALGVEVGDLFAGPPDPSLGQIARSPAPSTGTPRHHRPRRRDREARQ